MATALPLLLLTGCLADRSDSSTLPLPKNHKSIRFYLEHETRDGFTPTSLKTLVASRLGYEVESAPTLTENDIVGVDLVRVDSGRLALAFRLNREATESLYLRTIGVSKRGIILEYNGVPIGVRFIRSPLSGGLLLTFVDIDDKDMAPLVLEMKEVIFNYQIYLLRLKNPKLRVSRK